MEQRQRHAENIGQGANSDMTSEPGAPAETSLSPEERVNALVSQVEESNKGREQFKEMLQRLQADFTNYKRRTEEERQELQRSASSRLVLKLIPVLDEFALALDSAATVEGDAPWRAGVRLVQRKLQSILESENVTRIQVDHAEFNPVEHEAFAFKESTAHQEGQVISVVRDGYRMHDRVIRPALVILAKSPAIVERGDTGTKEREKEDA